MSDFAVYQLTEEHREIRAAVRAVCDAKVAPNAANADEFGEADGIGGTEVAGAQEGEAGKRKHVWFNDETPGGRALRASNIALGPVRREGISP